MLIDRDKYFGLVRSSLFGGTLEQIQVDGQSIILAVWEHQQKSTDLRWLAYGLATVYHETSQRFWPITEYGSQSYLQGKDYYPYIGRGFVQLTWDYNYKRATDELSLHDERNLVDHPDMALDSLIATRVLFLGMAQGWFTGKKLSSYFSDEINDPKNARRIINGNDKDTMIAGYHDQFLDALNASLIIEEN
jgi:putative chitinase